MPLAMDAASGWVRGLRIFTGAPLPLGADAVVMQEDVRREAGHLHILRRPQRGANLRRAEEETRKTTRPVRLPSRRACPSSVQPHRPRWLTQPAMVVVAQHATHKSAKAAEILKSYGCWLLFLPAYSPDPNPIEINRMLSRTGGIRILIFSKLKAHLRQIEARTFDQLLRALRDICALLDPNECWNFFQAAGYASD